MEFKNNGQLGNYGGMTGMAGSYGTSGVETFFAYEKLNTIGTDLFVIKITIQKFRKNDFFKGDNTFRASSGITLISDHWPQYDHENAPGIVFVRGDSLIYDDYLIVLQGNIYKQFEDAVKEYNQSMRHDAHMDYVQINMGSFHRNTIERLEKAIEGIRNAVTPDQLMTAKRRYMAELTEFPLGAEYCYYCHKYRDATSGKYICGACEYGKKYGGCYVPNSAYQKMLACINKMKDAVQEYWMIHR